MLSTPVPSAWIQRNFGASRTTWSAIGGEKHRRMSVSAIKGSDLVMVADDIDGESAGNRSSSIGLVAGAHRFLDFGENKDVHAGTSGLCRCV